MSSVAEVAADRPAFAVAVAVSGEAEAVAATCATVLRAVAAREPVSEPGTEKALRERVEIMRPASPPTG